MSGGHEPSTALRPPPQAWLRRVVRLAVFEEGAREIRDFLFSMEWPPWPIPASGVHFREVTDSDLG